MSKYLIRILASLVIVVLFSCTVFANDYCVVNIPSQADHGIRGDFTIPVLVSSEWNSTDAAKYNKINFEEWITVNDTTSWFEIGYKEGCFSYDGYSSEYYEGFFKAKKINGVFVADKLIKSFSRGTTYTFTIVDYIDNNHLWEIYVGSTYFGSFSDSPVYVSGGYPQAQGFEIRNGNGATQYISSTTLDDQYIYNKVNNVLQWIPWSNRTVGTQDSTSLVNVQYNSQNNISTFTAQ